MERSECDRMRANQENEKCAKCGEGIGEIPIFDDEFVNYWICEKCDVDMEWTTMRVERLKDEN